jgi:hypothetical protein
MVTFSVKQRGCPGGLGSAPSNRQAVMNEVGVPGKSGERLKYGRGFSGFKGCVLAPMSSRNGKDEWKMNGAVRSSSGSLV